MKQNIWPFYLQKACKAYKNERKDSENREYDEELGQMLIIDRERAKEWKIY